MPRASLTKLSSLALAVASGLLGLPAALGQSNDDPLEPLMRLSLETTTVQYTSPRDQSELAARCAEQSRNAHSYRSWLIQRDFSMDYLKPRNFAYVEWRFEFAGAGRFHVRQAIHEKPPLGEMLDERISIGDDHFMQAGSWIKAPKEMAPEYVETNRFLGLDKFAEILRTAKPTLAGTATVGERKLAFIEYDGVSVEGYQILYALQGMKCRARMWIDAATGNLVKGELIFRGKDSSDRPVHKVFEQVFSDYNQEITVQAPSLERK